MSVKKVNAWLIKITEIFTLGGRLVFMLGSFTVKNHNLTCCWRLSLGLAQDL